MFVGLKQQHIASLKATPNSGQYFVIHSWISIASFGYICWYWSVNLFLS